MNEKFFDLKKEKQDRIINASLKVFADNGYRHASTDDIVAQAGISKGLLFHYFSSKLGLYTFLFDYSVRFMVLEISPIMHTSEDDFFVLYRRMEAAKLQVLKNYPYMQYFIESIRYEDVKEALLATEEKKNMLKEIKSSVLDRADQERFRAEADPDKLTRMLDFTMKELMIRHCKEDSFHPDMMLEEIDEYLRMMKALSYS